MLNKSDYSTSLTRCLPGIHSHEQDRIAIRMSAACCVHTWGRLTIYNDYGMFDTEPIMRRGLPLHHVLRAYARVSSDWGACRALHRIMLGGTLVLATAVLIEYRAIAQDTSPPRRDTRIVVYKGNQTLELHRNGNKTAVYRVCLGAVRGRKTVTGDCKTPEGDYFICTKSTASRYCRFLGISYPGVKDAQSAFETGLISRNTRDAIVRRIKNGQPPPWNTKLGGWVGIHGYPTEVYRSIWVALFYPKPHNWTDGCIAMWNFEIEDLFSRVQVGTPVTILP